MNLVKLIARVLLVMIVFSAFLGAMEIATSRTAHADSLPQYTVEADTAAGGVYARYDPHTNDTARIGGYGVYPGETVELLCGVTDGDPVGIYQNTIWHFVSDLSNPGEGTFWLSDYYVNTPNLTANQLAPNEIMCANEGSTPLPPPTTSQTPTATAEFFSPWNIIPQEVTGNRFQTVDNVELNQWAPGGCFVSNFVTNKVTVMPDGPDASDVLVPPTVTTLAGWSKGRLGPLYFLAGATQAQIDAIHTIILFDPGSTNDFSGGGACDIQYDPNALYANWLESNPSNRLIVITGIGSEEKFTSKFTFLPSTFAGLKKYYFADLTNTTVGSNQVLWCDYNGLSHEDVLRYFGYLMTNLPSSCPAAPAGYQLATLTP